MNTAVQISQEEQIIKDHDAIDRKSLKTYFNSGTFPFWLVHLASLIAFFIPFHWSYVALAIGSYYGRMFFVTGSYHRYFAHRTYKTSRAFQFVLAFLAQCAVQKGVLWWAACHRDHHRNSDQAGDLHSPKDGWLWSHVGWAMSKDLHPTRFDKIKDFMKFPELVWLSKYHWVPLLTYCAVLVAFGGFPALVWGFFVSTTLLWHGTYTINSLSHLWGTRRYETTDTSRNNFVLSLITLGEGWHNNHHRYAGAARNGFYWWEIDITYYGLKLLSYTGLIWDLNPVPAEAYSQRK